MPIVANVHPNGHARLDTVRRLDVDAHEERREIRLPLLARLLEICKARCLRQEADRSFDLLPARDRRPCDLIALGEARCLLLGEIDVVVAPLALEQHDRRALRDHITFLCEHLENLAVLRRAQDEALLLHLELIKRYEELLALLLKRRDVVAHIRGISALLRNRRQCQSVRRARILGAREQAIEELLLLRYIRLSDLERRRRVIERGARDRTGLNERRLALVIELAVSERRRRCRDRRALLVDLTEALRLIIIRLLIAHLLAAVLARNLRLDLCDLRLRLFDCEIRIRRVELHDNIALLDVIALLDRLMDQPATHGIKRHLHLLRSQDALFLRHAERHGVIAAIEQDRSTDDEEHKEDDSRTLRFLFCIHQSSLLCC